MIRSVTPVLALLLALPAGPAWAQAPEPPAGNWKLMITTEEGALPGWLLRFASKDGKWTGEVLAVNVLPGDPASQSTPAVRLASRARLHVNVSVDENDVSLVSVGDPVTLTVDAWPDLSLAGQVARVETFGETVQGLLRYTVRVDLLESDPRLYLNMTANASIVTAVQEAALAVPLDAIQFDDGGEFVRLDANALSRVGDGVGIQFHSLS